MGKIVHKRVLNRFVKYLLYMGLSTISAREMKVDHFCKMVADFALEYRTTREKVQQQQQKKANNRERKKTRGKMIVDDLDDIFEPRVETENFKNKETEAETVKLKSYTDKFKNKETKAETVELKPV